MKQKNKNKKIETNSIYNEGAKNIAVPHSYHKSLRIIASKEGTYISEQLCKALDLLFDQYNIKVEG